ncbi:hypothetical protein Misp03_15140 [Microbispora sp. NBRC 16548]|nr:hypothetical protein Misp03_15140 [Microbispora sp. NBRC 16548]
MPPDAADNAMISSGPLFAVAGSAFPIGPENAPVPSAASDMPAMIATARGWRVRRRQTPSSPRYCVGVLQREYQPGVTSPVW